MPSQAQDEDRDMIDAPTSGEAHKDGAEPTSSPEGAEDYESERPRIRVVCLHHSYVQRRGIDGQRLMYGTATRRGGHCRFIRV